MRLLCVIGLLAGGAEPHSDASPFVPTGAPTAPPRGLSDLCRRDAATCRSLADGGAPAQLDPDTQRETLNEVDHTVNDRVAQRPDTDRGEPAEVWRLPGLGHGAAGDCEDLALEKMRLLLDRGFPRDRLFLAVVYRRDVGLHTVLVGRTDGGDLVLDSRTPWIEPWHDADYSWVAVQRPGRLLDWRVVRRG